MYNKYDDHKYLVNIARIFKLCLVIREAISTDARKLLSHSTDALHLYTLVFFEPLPAFLLRAIVGGQT